MTRSIFSAAIAARICSAGLPSRNQRRVPVKRLRQAVNEGRQFGLQRGTFLRELLLPPSDIASMSAARAFLSTQSGKPGK